MSVSWSCAVRCWDGSSDGCAKWGKLGQGECKPLDGDLDRYVAAAVASELAELDAAPQGARNDALNRASFNLAGFVKAGALPEDWARGQLEARAVNLGLSIIESRGTINSAFNAAQPRDIPR